MADGVHDILLRAIARNDAIVLSFPFDGAAAAAADGSRRHHKSRFLSGAPTGFWAELPPGQGPKVDELIASGQPVYVSFKNGADTLRFASVVRRQDAHRVNATTRVAALRLDFPSEIRSTAAAAADAARLAAVQTRRDPTVPGWIARMRGG